MNKPALKRFATEARRELLERVELQARKIGITSEGIQKATIESSDAIFINGRQLREKEKTQRNKLISRIREIGFDRVMEEVAYTWFNRFTALRFMEVNDYLPTKVRVLSSTKQGSTEPDMMNEALTIDLDLDKEYVYELKLNNNDEELFKYLVIKHCNDLNRYMPFMFETIDHYTEILFPEGLLAADSFIRKMTNIEIIPESNWEKIEVIGWLYQYYIAEEKDRVFKAKKKYKAEEIPFATQLFTPDWIVRYMVQNSLGRYWVEANPEHQDLIDNWEFYLQNTEEGFEEKIAPYINKELKVEEIKCFDPAMGSGHILVYMFDVLYEIYSKSGYMERDIPRLIIENNLYGLDIDDRAYQLACFSVVMKATNYNERFLRSIKKEGLVLNLASIQETKTFTNEDIEFIVGNSDCLVKTQNFLKQFQNAKSIGSLIKITDEDTSYLEERLESIQTTPVTNLFEIEMREKVLGLLPEIIKQARIMSLEFDVIVTNPPYMGASSMNKELSDYLKKYYPDSKADLFAAFMEVDHFIKPNGFYASINQHAWMFLATFEQVRRKLVQSKFIENMLHLGPRAFEEIGGEVVQSTTFVFRNSLIPKLNSVFIRLIDQRTAALKKEMAIKSIQRHEKSFIYSVNQNVFEKIPSNSIAYWASEKMINNYTEGKLLQEIASPKTGMTTADNNRFLRLWFEVSYENTALNISNKKEAIDSKKKWFPYSKGGGYRKWKGFDEYLVNWENNGFEIKNNKDSSGKKLASVRSEDKYFKPGITWSAVTSYKFSARLVDSGRIFDSGGSSIFPEDDLLFLTGLLNNKISEDYLSISNPTMNFQPRDIANIPVIYPSNVSLKERIVNLVKDLCEISENDWNSYERSWDFEKHPFMNYSSSKIETAYTLWEKSAEERYNQLKQNEEELNRIFINIYSMQDEISDEVEDRDVTISKAVLERDVRSFISYAIGCLFGRYSLDKKGLIYAGGEFDSSTYKKFPVDEDNIIPILPEAYFNDDVVTQFIRFVQTSFGETTVEENLDFLSISLGKKENETSREAIRRYFLNDFYSDHLQFYRNRPIYWLFTSGKEKAFNCLVYMHRYDKTTLSRIRTEYLHEVQIRNEVEKKDLLNIIEGKFPVKEINRAKKELKSIDKKIEELKSYDELLHHLADKQININLDDGVKNNYKKFNGLVFKI